MIPGELFRPDVFGTLQLQPVKVSYLDLMPVNVTGYKTTTSKIWLWF